MQRGRSTKTRRPDKPKGRVEATNLRWISVGLSPAKHGSNFWWVDGGDAISDWVESIFGQGLLDYMVWFHKTTRSGSSLTMNLYSDCFVWKTWILVFFFWLFSQLDFVDFVCVIKSGYLFVWWESEGKSATSFLVIWQWCWKIVSGRPIFRMREGGRRERGEPFFFFFRENYNLPLEVYTNLQS